MLELEDKAIKSYYKYFRELKEKVKKIGEWMGNFIKRMET